MAQFIFDNILLLKSGLYSTLMHSAIKELAIVDTNPQTSKNQESPALLWTYGIMKDFMYMQM